MSERSVIVFVYNSADDPLFKGNLLPLLQQMSRSQPSSGPTACASGPPTASTGIRLPGIRAASS
jgi:hypothetical protein